MNYKVKQFSYTDKNELKMFLEFPKNIYGKNEIMQNEDCESALICGNHTLSRYFSVFPFIAVDENDNTAARCMLTLYPDRDCAYIGFFESIDDTKAAASVMKAAEKLAKKQGYRSIVGPVDSSFWIRYRLKTNHFEDPYSGEPYNKDYYEKFFIENGYELSGEYISNRFNKVPKGFVSEKFEEREKQFQSKGYKILSPNPDTFIKALSEIYEMLIELYSDFQTYSRITLDEFIELYKSLNRIADYSMVKIAYYEGKAVGFFVSIPNYGNLICGKISLSKLLRIFKIKRRCSDYVMLYMGVDPHHHGLGKALAESIRQSLTMNGAESIGALIRKGKVNADYFSELVRFKYEYKLYEKVISE